MERLRFHKRNQEEGKSVTLFVSELKKQAEHCEFKDVQNNTIRARLVCGLRSEAIQKRLLTESALTQEKAIEISVSMELAAREAHQLSTSGKLHKVSPERWTQNKCYRCDKAGHMASECWSKDVDCRRCDKKGHIKRVAERRRETSIRKEKQISNTDLNQRMLYTTSNKIRKPVQISLPAHQMRQQFTFCQ